MSLTNIGTVVSVSAALPATETDTDYAGLTWSEVTGVSSLGEIGASFEILNHVDLKDGVTRKAKGAKNNGDPALQYRIVEGDAGQGILITALDSPDPISMKVVRPSGRIQYCQAIVASAPDSEATSGAVNMRSTNLGVTSDLIEVAAP